MEMDKRLKAVDRLQKKKNRKGNIGAVAMSGRLSRVMSSYRKSGQDCCVLGEHGKPGGHAGRGR